MHSSHKKVSPKVELQSPLHNDSEVRAPNFGSIRDNNITIRRNKPSIRVAMVKAATYDGSNSWLDYNAHVETCAEINNWSYSEKGLYLAVSLRGQAQGVLGNLSSKSKNYDSLVKALEERFALPNQT